MNIDLIEAASSEIEEYNQTEAGLADLRSRMKGVEYDVATVKGMIVAKADRAEVRGLRTGLETMRKQIKAPALAHCKLIDAEAARITGELLKLEEPIDKQIKARELVLETERVARELAERNRITAIHQNIAEIRAYQALATGCRTAAAIQTLIDKLANIELTGFEEFEEVAKTARIDTMHAMEEAHAQKLEDETERARVEAEQDEAAAKLKKDRADIALEDALIKSFDSAARRIEFNNTTYIKKAILQYESTGGDWENDQRPRVVSAFLAGREYLSERLNAAIDKEEIDKQRAELAAQQTAFAAQQAALSPVAIAPSTIETAAEELMFQPDAAEWLSSDMAGVVDAVVESDDVLILTGEKVVVHVAHVVAPTSREIYAMCMESRTADQFAVWLCQCASVQYPPVNEGVTA